MQRRIVLQSILASVLGAHLPARAAVPAIEVYKTPSCGCCHLWLDHLRAKVMFRRAKSSACWPNVRKSGVWRCPPWRSVRPAWKGRAATLTMCWHSTPTAGTRCTSITMALQNSRGSK